MRNSIAPYARFFAGEIFMKNNKSEADKKKKKETDGVKTEMRTANPPAEEKESGVRSVPLISGILILVLLAVLLTLKFAQKQKDEKSFYFESVAGVRHNDPDAESSVPNTESGQRDAVLVNVNTADVYDLCRLPGIGQKRAEAIVSYRLENGPFASPADLLNVKGIGEKTLEEIAPLICFFEEE